MARPNIAKMKALGLAFAGLAWIAATGPGLAQTGGSSGAAKQPPAPGQPAPNTTVAGSFGNWTLLCGKEDAPAAAEKAAGQERCSLVMPLVEKESQKLVFRVIVTYGPKGNLVLRVDGPTGVALQRGMEFSPDLQKTYRIPFQTCLPMGCKALLLVEEALRKEIAGSKQGSITVYALNGQAVSTLAKLDGFNAGMAALDKRVAKAR